MLEFDRIIFKKTFCSVWIFLLTGCRIFRKAICFLTAAFLREDMARWLGGKVLVCVCGCQWESLAYGEAQNGEGELWVNFWLPFS